MSFNRFLAQPVEISSLIGLASLQRSQLQLATTLVVAKQADLSSHRHDSNQWDR